MTIKDLPAGKSATILKVGGDGALRQHFLDMGLIQGAEVTVIKYAHLQNQLSVLPLSLNEFHIFLNLVAAHRVPATDISSAAYS